VHGSPIDNFARSGSRGINLCRFSLGFDIGESITPNWSNTTTIKFEVGNKNHCAVFYKVYVVSFTATIFFSHVAYKTD
jgi:hypothetical protein